MIHILPIIIAGILNGEMDTIKVNPEKAWFPKWDWWVSNNWQYKNKFIQWLMRYPLSFLKDGWHLCKSLMIVCFCLTISFSWIAIVYYVAFGIAFNISFHSEPT